MKLIARKAIGGPEASNPLLYRSLLSLEASELGIAAAQRAQMTRHEGAQGATLFGRPQPSGPVDVVGKRDRDVLHALTV